MKTIIEYWETEVTIKEFKNDKQAFKWITKNCNYDEYNQIWTYKGEKISIY